jgi:hypothetical protein
MELGNGRLNCVFWERNVLHKTWLVAIIVSKNGRGCYRVQRLQDIHKLIGINLDY